MSLTVAMKPEELLAAQSALRDIHAAPALIDYVQALAQAQGREHLTVSPGALQWLQSLPWPGNVRQLKQWIERTALVTTLSSSSVSVALSAHCGGRCSGVALLFVHVASRLGWPNEVLGAV